jgi:hypothetical protein
LGLCPVAERHAREVAHQGRPSPIRTRMCGFGSSLQLNHKVICNIYDCERQHQIYIQNCVTNQQKAAGHCQRLPILVRSSAWTALETLIGS